MGTSTSEPEQARTNSRRALEDAAGRSFDAIAAVFRDLPPTSLDVRGFWASGTGRWRGTEIGPHAGCMAGTLSACGWVGKNFYADGGADALVFDRDGHSAPMRAPSAGMFRLSCSMPALLRASRFPPTRWLGRAVMKETTERTADLKPLVMDDTQVMSMSYRALDVTDCFKYVDERTVLGGMFLQRHDALDAETNPPSGRRPVFYFLLTKDD